ncbi:hypothetical protein Fmac_012119 [Flemingia macrophylla]|uniref:Dirigent protein n=1 Tax=Flemingia macrophylla TaxID=520843 RepID=A0ABD1MPE6_9FABA
MATQLLLVTLLFLSYTLTNVMGDETGFVGSVDPKSLGLDKKQTVSHFKFYWHDIVSGSNATSATIIPSLPKYNTTTSFGMVSVMDNPLTVGPELGSKLVGRAEGFYSFTSQSQLHLSMVMNFALSEGKYNGSSISILGRYVVNDEVKDMPVIGGTGLFRFATGFAEGRTYYSDPNTGDATTEYDIYVLHY